MLPIVIDTNVLVAGLRSGGGASREVIRRALDGRYCPLLSNPLWLEYEDLCNRPIWTGDTTHDDRLILLNALAAAGRWVDLYYAWRPNLPDEGDNHLVELAIAGAGRAIVSHKTRDLRRGELCWESLLVVTPAECLEVLR